MNWIFTNFSIEVGGLSLQTLGTAGVGIAMLTIVVLLLSLNIASKWTPAVKALGSACSLAMVVVIYVSIYALIGWPSSAAPPKKFQLHWAVVEEPNKSTGDRGGIYVWIEEVDGDGAPMWRGIPRAFKVPYDRKTHERVNQALENIKRGQPTMGSLEGEGTMEGDGPVGNRESRGELMFHDLPPPKVVPKGPPGRAAPSRGA